MKPRKIIITFICLAVSIIACLSLNGCKNKDGLSKKRPTYDDAQELCKQEIEKDGECFYVIQPLSNNLENIEPNTYYFYVQYIPNRVGGTPKNYLVTVSYTKNNKNYYEHKIEKSLVY